MKDLIALWAGIIAGLAAILTFLYRITGDYGIAIILLTIAIRVIMLPLTIKQTKSMQEMQKIQPKLKKLQEKYKNDKEKLQQEMMNFYKEHKVNPLGGCLPTLLQFPVMIALFRMLYTNKKVANATFLISSWELGKTAGNFHLSQWATALPYYILIALMVVTTYIPQKMMSQDPQQEKIMLFMTVFMAWIAWNLPSGVLIYWVTTNVWTIGQQYIMMRPARKKEVVKDAKSI